MASTMLFNKDAFMRWVSDQIKDDEVVVVSASPGDISINNKNNSMHVNFGFAADAIDVDPLEPVVPPCAAMFICGRDQLTPESQRVLADAEKGADDAG